MALTRTELKRTGRIRSRGKRAWKPTEPAGYGCCVWCRKWSVLTWDHVIPRSLLPGELRDHEDNLVRACWYCNTGRTAGLKPKWSRLPDRVKAFVLKHKGEIFIERYFTKETQ